MHDNLILVGNCAVNHYRQWMSYRQQGTRSWHCCCRDARRRADNRDRQV